ncbi:MAG TPA: response regulator, partial [Flavisolibacter sp.]|nr:response regulator [Flavisolibacter sp.]
MNEMLPVVLLVDDEEEILDFLERLLRTKYTVLKAGSAEEALPLLKAEAVQLVVSDVMMPGMNGMELCRTIKASLEYAHIP